MIISILLLFIAISISSVSYFLLMTHIGLLRSSLYDALYTAERAQVAYLDSESVTEQWKRSRATFYILGFHSDISEIETDILSLAEFALYGDKESFRETCISCVHKLDSLKNSSKVTIANVLKWKKACGEKFPAGLRCVY